MAAMRAYRPSDDAALRRICLETADNGGDATALYGDGALLADLYAVNYAVHAPRLALVFEDEAGVGGYAIGVADTDAFETWMRATWLPRLGTRNAGCGTPADRAERRPMDDLLDEVRDPPTRNAAIVKEYPAHLHLNLLPRLQGKGRGRALFEAWRAAARNAGAGAAHVAVYEANGRGLAFWRAMGFEALAEEPDRAGDAMVYLGRRL